MVEGIKTCGDIPTVIHDRDCEIKVTKLTEVDDIEAYLNTFECLMQAYEVPQERWAFKLAPQLVSKAQQTYAALSPVIPRIMLSGRRPYYFVMILMRRATASNFKQLPERKEELIVSCL